MSVQRILTASPVLNVMISAVQKAGRGLIRDFGEIEQLQVSRKSLGDFVSTADQRSEKILIEELTKARPDYSFIVEESGEILGKDKDSIWMIDPLDGTSNFLHGIPYFVISVALQQKGSLVAAVIYNPVINEMYWAEKGGGAFLNHRRLRVSGRRQLDEALVATGAPFSRHGNTDHFLHCFQKLVPLISGVRRYGSAALDLAYLAAGRLDGLMEMNLAPWDMAAGALLVQEAGGYVSDFQGQSDILKFLTDNQKVGHLIAGNETLFPILKDLVRKTS